jgi:hypothetical protein
LSNQQAPPRSAQTFIAALTGIEHGSVALKADDLLRQLVQDVNKLGRKGSVTVTIEVRPAKGNSTSLQVAATADAKLPQPDAPWGLFFFTEDGALTRDDPRYAEALFSADGSPAQ